MPLIFMQPVYHCLIIEISSVELMDFADACVSSAARQRQEAIDALIESGRYGNTEDQVRTYLSGHVLQCTSCWKEYKSQVEGLTLIRKLVGLDKKSL